MLKSSIQMHTQRDYLINTNIAKQLEKEVFLKIALHTYIKYIYKIRIQKTFIYIILKQSAQV